MQCTRTSCGDKGRVIKGGAVVRRTGEGRERRKEEKGRETENGDRKRPREIQPCLLYTSDAADDWLVV